MKDEVDIFLKTLLKISSTILVVYVFTLFFSCSDDVYLAGYNKDLEKIHYQMFEVDSLLKTINMNLDSLNANNWNK
tara:strand:+ start:201 stop:428 length:228 start_codon:yes stop_codon:yes gene_type:complete